MNEMKKQLRFNANGKIRIMLFGDLHENSDVTSPEGKAKFEAMQLLMKTAAARLKPDLAVLWVMSSAIQKTHLKRSTESLSP